MTDSGLQENLKRRKLANASNGDGAGIENSMCMNVSTNVDASSSQHCATVERTLPTTDIDDSVRTNAGVSQKRTVGGIRNERDFENLICIEIFSGSGRLTAAIRKIGIRAVAIDRSSQRTTGPVTLLDLTKSSDLQYLLNFIETEKDNILLIHMAPPCGTASAARNRRRKHLEEAGFVLPVPLRSKEYPMGLPTLKGLDLDKVTAANSLYDATAKIAMHSIGLNLTVSIENPQNSLLFWLTDPIRELLQWHPGNFNVLDSCMMGGDRDKATAWWCSDDLCDSLNLRCDNMR